MHIYRELSYTNSTKSAEDAEPKISASLCRFLYSVKEKITTNERNWDIYKKYTNPCEYIHSVVPYKKRAVSKYKPLSRSFFKMIELLHIFDFPFFNTPIRSFHLAEGPGGFIEAICKMRQNPTDTYIGMTLQDDTSDTNIPSWKKSQAFLQANPNVVIENGADGTGNILCMTNFMYVASKYASSMDFITADGGFDFSLDFNQQEIVIAKLLFGQIAYALVMQKQGGTFILKVFDCFMSHTVDLLYLLASFYEKTCIIKPKTSRYANSEKYIVCTGFLHKSNIEFFPYLYDCFYNMMQKPEPVHRFLKVNVPTYFLQRLEEYNAIFGQKQIQNIHYTIMLMTDKGKQDKIDILVRNNVQKSVDWCIKYGVPYVNLNNSNMFVFE
jgi:23S rRNA U2552 (ribose-2'-O)-methylase RlmE/FtsJ